MTEEKMSIKTQDEKGAELELFFVKPNYRIMQSAQREYNLVMARLMREGAKSENKLLSRNQLNKYLENLGIWTMEDALTFGKLQLEIRELERRLKIGGIKLTDARRLAIDIRAKRATMIALYAKRAEYDETTMEFEAERQRFKYLLVECVHVASGEKFFETIEEYEDRQNEMATIDSAKKLSSYLFNYEENVVDNFPENKWLKQYGYINDKGQFTNREGQLVDLEGRLIDENGRFIDAKGEFVDVAGRKVDKEGEFVIDEPQPFYDEDWKPVVPISG